MPPRESQVIVTYGPAKKGKTTDLGFTFPTGVFFAPAANSLFPLKNVVGIKPQVAIVPDIEWVHQFVTQHKDDEKIVAVVIDDAALLSDVAVDKWQAASPGWYAYQRIKQICQDICVVARKSPWHLVLDSHERSPGVDDGGIFKQGGPVLPGKQAGPAIEKNASMILHAEVSNPLSDKGASDESWPVVYSCDPADHNFITGDRNGFALPKNPMNLREILFAGGIELPYPQPWMAEWVAKTVELKDQGQLTPSVLNEVSAGLQSKRGATQLEVDWIFRDARARLFMRKHSTRRSEMVRAGLLRGV